jgi:hypothetical protein
MSLELTNKCAPDEQGSEIEAAQRLARKCGISLVPDALFLLAAGRRREDVRLCAYWFKDSRHWECSQYVLGYRVAGHDIVVASTGTGFRYLYWGPAAEKSVADLGYKKDEGLLINDIRIWDYKDLWARAVNGGWYLRSRQDAPIVYEALKRLAAKGSTVI